MKGNQCFGINL